MHSFACSPSLSSAVRVPHQPCRSLTPVPCSSLWLITQWEVNNMARGWCDFKASAKTPAWTLDNTLEAAQSPTLSCFSVGSPLFNHPTQHQALPYWWLSYCYVTNSMTQLIHCGIFLNFSSVSFAATSVCDDAGTCAGEIGANGSSGYTGTSRWSHVSLPAFWLNTKLSF